MCIQGFALMDCLRFSQKSKTAILNNAVSCGLGASGSAARHTGEGALPLVLCRGVRNEWGPSFLC